MITGGSVTGIGMCTTGLGDTAASVSATNSDPAHSSSTWSNEPCQRSGNTDASHHHRPIVWRPSKNVGPTCAARPGSMSALTHTRLIG